MNTPPLSWILSVICSLFFMTAYGEARAEGLVERLSRLERQVEVLTWQNRIGYFEVINSEYADLEGLADGSEKAQDRQRATVEELGLPLQIELPNSGITFRLIPPGTFAMSSPEDESRSISRTVQHPFYISKYEIMQHQWENVMGAFPGRFHERDVDGRKPVINISYRDAQRFVKELSRYERLPSSMIRLPSEVEWEYACRAGTTTPYVFGDDISKLPKWGNFADSHATGQAPDKHVDKTLDDGYSRSAHVGSYKPNAWGLHDVHGNVWEFATTEQNGVPFVFRGGSWWHPPKVLQSDSRVKGSNKLMSLRSADYGLRLVLDLESMVIKP